MRILPLLIVTSISVASLQHTTARAGGATTTDERGIQVLVRETYLRPHRPIESGFAGGLLLNGGLYSEFSLEFRPLRSWSTELAVGVPTDFDVAPGSFAHVRLMPVTWTAKRDFAPGPALHPYVGIGLHYTKSSLVVQNCGNECYEALESNTVGWVLQTGFNAQLTRGWFMNLDIRYLGKLDPQRLNFGVPTGETYAINPFLIGLGIGYRWTVQD